MFEDSREPRSLDGEIVRADEYSPLLILGEADAILIVAGEVRR